MAATLDEEMGTLVERIFALPFDAQLALLRAAAPQILGWLDSEGQAAFLHDLMDRLARAASGELAIEPPPGVPTY